MWNPHEPISKSTEKALGLGAIFFVLIAWSILTVLPGSEGAASFPPGPSERLVSPGFLPAPWEVVGSLWRLTLSGDLVDAILWSGSRVAISIFFVVLVGVPTGVLMGSSPKVNAALSPLIDPFRSAPLVAALPILVMWFGIGETMKIAFLFLGAVVYLVPMVRDAIQAVPADHITMSQDIGGTPFEIVWHTIVPLAKPRIADAIIVSVGITWTYITVAEYVNAKQGLGMIISNGRRLSASDQVFGGILTILAIALLTDYVLRALKNKFYSWEIE